MFRVSNSVVGVVNVVTFLVGAAAVGLSLFIQLEGGEASECQKVVQVPLMFGGIFVMVVSAVGMGGSMCRMNMLLYLYLILTFLLIVALIMFTLFALLITNQKVSHRGFREYTTWDFHNYLQKYVLNDNNWAHIKSCLIDSRLCTNLAVDGHSPIYRQLTTAQTGCCKPPVACGFSMVNATHWEGGAANANADPDCATWSNQQERLCYDCNSCKGGVLANIRSQWRRLAILNTSLLLLLIVVYLLACCAVSNNRSHSPPRYDPYA